MGTYLPTSPRAARLAPAAPQSGTASLNGTHSTGRALGIPPPHRPLRAPNVIGTRRRRDLCALLSKDGCAGDTGSIFLLVAIKHACAVPRATRPTSVWRFLDLYAIRPSEPTLPCWPGREQRANCVAQRFQRLDVSHGRLGFHGATARGTRGYGRVYAEIRINRFGMIHCGLLLSLSNAL